MQDKRITKTKRNFKDTLISLIREKEFEKITVTEICQKGNSSRITFYTYYEDKYALVNDIFQDYIREADLDYHRMQAENNPENDVIKGYSNFLDCILNLYYNNLSFFARASASQNPYLHSAFYQLTFLNVDKYISTHTSVIKAKYSSKETAALICSGLWAVISEATAVHGSQKMARKNVKSMAYDLLQSDLFIKTN